MLGGSTLGLMLCTCPLEILKSLILESVFCERSPVGRQSVRQGLGALARG